MVDTTDTDSGGSDKRHVDGLELVLLIGPKITFKSELQEPIHKSIVPTCNDQSHPTIRSIHRGMHIVHALA